MKETQPETKAIMEYGHQLVLILFLSVQSPRPLLQLFYHPLHHLIFFRLERVNKELADVGNDNSIWSSKLHYQQGKLEYYIKELRDKMADNEFKKAMSNVVVGRNE